VFSIDRELLSEIARAAKLKKPMDACKGRPTLKLIQSIKTVPSAFPTKLNTCGRICVHQSGRFVIVSNRGHESLTIFRVKQSNGQSGKARRGTLAQVGFFHTRGETPRHFQFDQSGQFLIVANQDSDTIAVFSFNLTSGEIKYSGNEYRVPSPNFVCSCPMYDRDGDDEDNHEQEKVGHHIHLTEEDNTSTIPTSVEFDHYKKDYPTDLQSELEIARKEIAELRKQISSMTVTTDCLAGNLE
jgi:6-phosphogluconolactonase